MPVAQNIIYCPIYLFLPNLHKQFVSRQILDNNLPELAYLNSYLNSHLANFNDDVVIDFGGVIFGSGVGGVVFFVVAG